MKKNEFTKEEITLLLKLVCNETQKQSDRNKTTSSIKDLTKLYELRYKLRDYPIKS